MVGTGDEFQPAVTMPESATQKLTRERIENDFEYHAPDEAKAKQHQEVRMQCQRLAHLIQALVPEGREQSLAITKVEEAMMWANAGIARH